MSKITRPAARINQGDLTLFTTSLKVRDLLSPNFYSVEALDPENPNDRGYQRLLNKARAKKLSDYIVAGQDTHDAFLPTSIFLATDKDLPFNESNNTLTIDTNEIGAFSVVDGQHRVEGLRMAAEKDDRVLDFEVPVNIATNLSKIAQMCHFLIVNTTQKSVDQGVEQRIYARPTHAFELEDDIPHLPKWIRNTVGKGEDEKALKYVDFLNSTPDNPWKNRIDMANKEDKNGSIAQKSFVKSIKRYVLVADNPVASKPEDVQLGIFLNYWKAITNIIGVDEPTVLFKYVGVELFCKFFVPFCHKMINQPNFKVSTMQSLLQHTFDNAEGEAVNVGHTEFWVSGRKASGLNVSALTVINMEMVKALHSSTTQKEIEL
jgi:DGQHR domain-containing protein